MPATPGRILVIKLRAIGDVLLSTVVLPDLRAAFPDARIDMLCERPSADVLRGNPALDDVVVIDPKTDGSLPILRRVRARRYDLVIDLFGNPRSAIIAAASGAPKRVGYRFGWRRWCYTDIVEPRGGEVHNTEFNRDALRRLGVPVGASLPFFPLAPEAEEFAGQFLSARGLAGAPILGINAGGGWYTKRWEPERFAALARLVGTQYDAPVLLFWGPGEKERAEEIQSSLGGDAALIPPTSLKQLASLLKHCSLLVTNDSGPMHIAASLGVPIVALFGPTNPQFQGPVGSPSCVVRNETLDCLGCNLTDCPIGLPCMRALGAEEVFEKIRTFVGQYLPPRNLLHGKA